MKPKLYHHRVACIYVATEGPNRAARISSEKRVATSHTTRRGRRRPQHLQQEQRSIVHLRASSFFLKLASSNQAPPPSRPSRNDRHRGRHRAADSLSFPFSPFPFSSTAYRPAQTRPPAASSQGRACRPRATRCLGWSPRAHRSSDSDRKRTGRDDT
jgi:hypothetical protein